MKMTQRILIGLALLGFTVAASAAPYVVLRNGKQVQGTAIRSLSNGDINLTTAAGVQTFPKGSYVKAVADKPKAYDQAVAALRGGKNDVAIQLLEKVIADYRNLGWDVEAAKVLPTALLAKGQAEEAVRAFDKLFLLAPEEKQNPDIAWDWREAMLAAKQYGPLERQLDAVVKSGSRADAARAQNMRGDIQLAQNNLEPAVLDYLRTAILFPDVADPAIQGAAHWKAGQVLEKMRDPRAKEMYQRLVERYPSAPEASQARGKL